VSRGLFVLVRATWDRSVFRYLDIVTAETLRREVDASGRFGLGSGTAAGLGRIGIFEFSKITVRPVGTRFGKKRYSFDLGQRISFERSSPESVSGLLILCCLGLRCPVTPFRTFRAATIGRSDASTRRSVVKFGRTGLRGQRQVLRYL
jgi:hypothetical protein